MEFSSEGDPRLTVMEHEAIWSTRRFLTAGDLNSVSA